MGCSLIKLISLFIGNITATALGFQLQIQVNIVSILVLRVEYVFMNWKKITSCLKTTATFRYFIYLLMKSIFIPVT